MPKEDVCDREGEAIVGGPKSLGCNRAVSVPARRLFLLLSVLSVARDRSGAWAEVEGDEARRGLPANRVIELDADCGVVDAAGDSGIMTVFR